MLSVDSIENTDSNGIIFILHQSMAFFPQIFKNKFVKFIIIESFYARGSDMSNFELTGTYQYSIFLLADFFMNSLLYVDYGEKNSRLLRYTDFSELMFKVQNHGMFLRSRE